MQLSPWSYPGHVLSSQTETPYPFSLPLRPWTPPFYILPLWLWLPKGIIYHLYLGDWFISLTIMLLRLIHLIVFVRIFLLFKGWIIFHCRYIQHFAYSFIHALMSHRVWCDILSLWHLGDVGHIFKLATKPAGSFSHFLILLCPHPPACLVCSLILATASARAVSCVFYSFHGQRILLQGLVSAP